MTLPLRPAFSQILSKGDLHAFLMIWWPMFLSLRIQLAVYKADPPPATAPESIAALVAQNESSSLSASSIFSTSVYPPTLTTAIPFPNYPNLFSKSALECLLVLISYFTYSCRSLIFLLSPFPFTIRVVSLLTITFSHSPSTSSIASSL